MSTLKYLRLRTNYGIYSTISVAFLNTRYAVTEDIYRKIPKISPGFVCVTSSAGGGGLIFGMLRYLKLIAILFAVFWCCLF